MAYHERFLLRAALLTLTAIVLLGSAPPCPALAGELPHVLIINSYHRGYNWTDEQSDAMLRVIRALSPTSTQDVVYMDWKRHPVQQTITDLADTLRHRYQGHKVDLILTTDDAALLFALKYRKEFLSDAPVVYSGVFEDSAKEYYSAGEHDVTGVYEAVDPIGTIKLALGLNPGYRRAYIIHDASETSLALENEILEQLGNAKSKLETHVLTGMPFKTLLEQISSLPPDSFILLASYARDSQGLVMQPEQFAELMSKSSNSPIYTMYDHMLGNGVVGGSLLSGQLQGEAAATLGSLILGGQKADSLAPINRKTVFNGFDYKELLRFHLNPDLIPQGSTVLGRPHSFYRENKALVWIYSCFILSLLAAVAVMALNVIRRARAEKNLADQVRLMTTIAEAIPTPFFHKDISGKYLGCNKAFELYTGLSRDDIVGKSSFDISPGDAAADFTAIDKVITDSSDTETHEHTLDTIRGKRDMLVSKASYRDVSGRIAGVVGIITDITDHRRVEEELVRQKTLLASLVEATPDAVFIKDRKGRYILANSEVASVAGKSLDEIIGADDTAIFPPGEAAEVMANDQLVMESGQNKSYEEILSTTQGIRHYLCTKGPLRGDDGEVTGMFGISRDVTERVKVQELMVQTEKMMSVGGLAAGMAHEINNPLGSILQSIQVVKSRLDPSFEANRKTAAECGCDIECLAGYLEKRQIFWFIDGIREASVRAARIVRDMLDFSRKTNSNRTLASINDILDKSLELASNDYDLKKKYDFRKIDISRDYEQSIPSTNCSWSEIEQVVLNLLQNAAQAMTEKEYPPDEHPRITLRTRVNGENLAVEVEDNGPGMDPEVKRHVFEPFFTTKKPGQGTGLGLSVSYFIIVSNHQGTFGVESAPGKGSIFRFTLPVASRNTA